MTNLSVRIEEGRTYKELRYLACIVYIITEVPDNV